MIIKNELPRLTVFSPNRKDVLSTVAQPKHAKLQYNFNACSTIEFQIDKRILDTKTGEWIENPCYNDLAENNLLYMANASNVFIIMVVLCWLMVVINDTHYQVKRCVLGMKITSFHTLNSINHLFTTAL